MAYTYLIGWKQHNKYYYGVRYSRNCDPSDLWVTYFTSSKTVRDFVSKHGNPDIIEIRKTFDDNKRAILWEHKVLKRIGVIRNEKWLNKTDNISIPLEYSVHGWSEESRKKASLSHTGKKHTEKTKNKIGNKHKGKEGCWKGKIRKSHSMKMSGSNNPKSKPLYYDDKYFGTMKQLSETYGFSYHQIRKMIKNNEIQERK